MTEFQHAKNHYIFVSTRILKLRNEINILSSLIGEKKIIARDSFINPKNVNKSIENFRNKLKINRICSFKFALQIN
jgi:hypothetical protein